MFCITSYCIFLDILSWDVFSGHIKLCFLDISYAIPCCNIYIYISFKLMKPADSLVFFVTWSCTVINCVPFGCWFGITCDVLISYYVHFYTAISFILLVLFLVFCSLSFDIWSKYSCLIYIYTHGMFSVYFISYHTILYCACNETCENIMLICVIVWLFEYVQWFDGLFFVDHIYTNTYIYILM